tara:strand:+ start:827 stop:2011 length:1185 start_codon:yes stop_codon:yes gene_type:complete
MVGQANKPSAHLLDITRLINRAGLHPTGVDRVERAYLRHLADHPTPFFAIARTALGYVLLDRTGAASIAKAIASGDWGSPDMISRLNPRLDGPRKTGQSFLRRIAIARATKSRLRRLITENLPADFVYFNTGHSNLNLRMMQGVSGARKVVLLHDTIPLEYPQTQRAGAVQGFEDKLALVSRHADVVICTSAQCQADVIRHLSKLGPVPKTVMAHLGVDVPVIDAEFARPRAPYFVTVGTIEPRKNHALLLDIWQAWGADAPPLYLCGKRGWRNDAVFARLDQGVPNVIEANDLSDGQIAALVKGAAAMLFPSQAEGFGLPPAEALALGCRVVCADLAVYGEVLGNSAVYVALSDRYLWEKTIKELAVSGGSGTKIQYAPPRWADHFKTVLSKI